MWRISTFSVLLLVGNVSLADEKLDTCLTQVIEARVQEIEENLEHQGLFPSPEELISERRLEEKYCLKKIACFLEGKSDEEEKFLSGAMFSMCLSGYNSE